jgi:hypothetical protein
MEPDRLVVQSWSALLVTNERSIWLHEAKLKGLLEEQWGALTSNKINCSLVKA